MREPSIRRVDHRDAAEMAAFQRVYAEAERAEDPDAPLYSLRDTVAYLGSTDASWFYDGFAAYDGDVMVGETMVTGARHDNLDVARIWVWVPPAHAGQGVGSRLVEYAEQHALRLGRTIAHATTVIGPDRRHGYRRFAERLGYAVANTEVERRLSLPVDPALLDRLAGEATPHHASYEIRAVVGPVPPDLAPSYVALKNQLNVETPHGDLQVEAGRDTVAGLAVQDAELEAAGRCRVSAFAVTDDGAVVGYAVAAVTADEFDHVDQWGTLVDPAHRGHRLGMATKCAQLHTLAEHFPDKRYVRTTNAETNRAMVAINEALGFEVHQVHADLHKRLL